MHGVERLKIPDQVKMGVIQYLVKVAQLTPDELMDVADVDAEEIMSAMAAPNVLDPPIQDDQLIQTVKSILGRLGII